MRRSSAGQQWEDLNRRKQEAEEREMEARRVAANRAMRASIGGLPGLSLDNTLPIVEQQHFQSTESNSYRRRDDVPELEARTSSPPQYSWRAPPTPNEQIIQLQEEVTYKESKIKTLESVVKYERDRRRCLQDERHEAVEAQRRAEDGLYKLKQRVFNLDQLLDGSIKKQKELESELDNARQEVSDLKRRLHEERCSYESDIMARETRENRTEQQLDDAYRALGNEMRRDKNPNRDVGSILESGTQNAPSRSRRQDKSTSGKTYISVPKNGSRRAVWIFT